MRAAAGHAAAAALLVGAIPAILAAFWLPQHRPTTLALLAGFTAVRAAGEALRARRIANAALLRAADGASGFEVLGDELATWLELQPRAAGGTMLPWLGRAVDVQLPQLPPEALQRVGRRRFGRLRYLLAPIVLLLLAWLLLEWIQPPWPGAFGGKPDPARGAPGDGAAQALATGAGEAHSPPSPETAPDQPRRERPDAPPPPAQQQPDAEPPAPPEAPAPVLDLPAHLHFTVPEHIGDGPTRKVKMHAAELPTPASAAAVAPPPSAAGAGDPGEVPPPPPTAETFERAAEQALRARHVPEEEKAIVRRFFELLQKAGR